MFLWKISDKYDNNTMMTSIIIIKTTKIINMMENILNNK